MFNSVAEYLIDCKKDRLEALCRVAKLPDKGTKPVLIQQPRLRGPSNFRFGAQAQSLEGEQTVGDLRSPSAHGKVPGTKMFQTLPNPHTYN